MSFYTFDSDYQTVDATEIWDRMVEHVEKNETFQAVSRRKVYKAKLDNGNINYMMTDSNQSSNTNGNTETLHKDKTLCALDTVRLLSTLNTNTIRPYLRQANFPVSKCNPLIGLLVSVDVLKKS